MNYELMAKLLIEKNNLKFSTHLIKQMELFDAGYLISSTDNLKFLIDIRKELAHNENAEGIKDLLHLIDKRIEELSEREFATNGLPN
jgi:hypothetical protein